MTHIDVYNLLSNGRAIVESSGGYMRVYSVLFFQFLWIFEIFHNKKLGRKTVTVVETYL